jgi:hypothetical protein
LVKITSNKFKEFKAKHDDTIHNWIKEIEQWLESLQNG